jgi:hypothetical protein
MDRRNMDATTGNTAMTRLAAELRAAESAHKRNRISIVVAGVFVVAIIAIVSGVVGASAARKPVAAPASVSAAAAVVPAAAAPAVPEEAQVATEVAAAPDDVAVTEPAAEPTRPAPQPAKAAATAPKAQSVSVAIGAAGYQPSMLFVKAGVPVKLTVGKGEGCAAGFVISSLGLSVDNSAGPATLKIPALDPGKYVFTCGMGMVSGTLVAR